MKLIEGNILDVAHGVIVHQVNLEGIMGGGLALQIKERWEHIFTDYEKACKAGTLTLGGVQINGTLDDPWKFVANLAGQVNTSDPVCTKYEAYPEALKKIVTFATTYDLDIFIPEKIGCGLAGGDWDIMLPILEEHVPNATLVRYTPPEVE